MILELVYENPNLTRNEMAQLPGNSSTTIKKTPGHAQVRKPSGTHRK